MTHYHLIGVGGTGLSAIARVLMEMGHTISGSDLHLSPLVDSLKTEGADIFLGHQPKNVNGAEVVIRSSAIPDDNVEVETARSKGIPVLKRVDFISELMLGKSVVAVAGTHGKTTTSAMISWMLSELDQKPSFIVGGVISDFGVNAQYREGQVFVIEADEYDQMFLGLNPNIAIITNIEHDHPDCYSTLEEFNNAFQNFVNRLIDGGILIVCGDDEGAVRMVPATKSKGNEVFMYGIDEVSNDYRAINIIQDLNRGGYKFHVKINGKEEASLSLLVPGKHNVYNALASLTVADKLGLSLGDAAEALSSFRGIERRFEFIGKVRGVTVISDYAHHPTEIKATLSAANSRYPGNRIWAVWQPHTYSRTKLFFNEYLESFNDAHRVVITEIYPSREPIEDGYSSEILVNSMSHPYVTFIPGIPDAIDHLVSRLRTGDVLIVLSAGDADQICHQVLNLLK